MKRTLLTVLLIVISAWAAAPLQTDVSKVVDKHLVLVTPEVSTAQRGKIEAYVNAFPAADTTSPGYEFQPGGGHVTTLNRAGAYFQAGFEAVFKGNFKAAEYCFLKALKINPKSPVFLSNAAFTLNLFGYYSDALILLNYAVSLDPTFCSAWVNIGYAQESLHQTGAAQKAYEMAIALNPEVEEYQKLLAGAYESSKPGDKKKTDTDKIDAALDILGQKGQTDLSSGQPSSQVPKGQNKPGVSADDLDSLLSGMGQGYGTDMEIMKQFIPTLSYAGGQFLREAEWHEKKAGESGGVTKNVHTVGAAGYKLLSFLFTGYIQEITGSWDSALQSVDDAFRKIPQRPQDYNPAKGLAPEWHFPPIAVGFDGLSFKLDPENQEIEFEFGEGIIVGFSVSQKSWAVKIGVGIQAQAGVAGAGAGYFIKYDSAAGWGGELKGEVSCAGVKAEMPVWQHSFGFENMSN